MATKPHKIEKQGGLQKLILFQLSIVILLKNGEREYHFKACFVLHDMLDCYECLLSFLINIR